MALVFPERVRFNTTTTGTGTLTVGSAVSGFLTPAGASVANAATVPYYIEDGSNWEVGVGVYTSSGTTLSRTVLKSTNSNSAISLSGSAVVTVGVRGADMIGGWPVFVGTYSGTPGQSINAANFNTISLTASTDTHAAWNSGTNIWTVPSGQAGTYQIIGKMRLADGVTAAQSIGLGMHTSNADHADFFWGVTNPNRNGMLNERVVDLAVSDGIRLFTYLDTGAARYVTAASMSIVRIR